MNILYSDTESLLKNELKPITRALTDGRKTKELRWYKHKEDELEIVCFGLPDTITKDITYPDAIYVRVAHDDAFPTTTRERIFSDENDPGNMLFDTPPKSNDSSGILLPFAKQLKTPDDVLVSKKLENYFKPCSVISHGYMADGYQLSFAVYENADKTDVVIVQEFCYQGSAKKRGEITLFRGKYIPAFDVKFVQ